MWVELLVSADEGVLVDLPDLAVVVPRAQVALQISGVRLHAAANQRLDLLDLLIRRNQLVDRLSINHHSNFIDKVNATLYIFNIV